MADLQEATKSSQSESYKQANVFEARPRFVLEQCCFCCIPLRIGCLILGYLFLIATLISLIMTTMALVSVSVMINHPSLAPYRELLTKAIIISSIVEFLNLVALPFAVVLLVGLHKDKRNYLKIFIIFLLVCIGLNIIQRLASVIMFSEKRIVDGITTLLYIVFSTYFVAVLRSHYLTMGERCNNLPTQLARDGNLSTPKV